MEKDKMFKIIERGNRRNTMSRRPKTLSDSIYSSNPFIISAFSISDDLQDLEEFKQHLDENSPYKTTIELRDDEYYIIRIKSPIIKHTEFTYNDYYKEYGYLSYWGWYFFCDISFGTAPP